jgi:hypothetical protein
VKYTHQDVERAFRLLCQLLGRTEGYGIGQWHLDHARDYGGYVVTGRGEDGGEARPLGGDRLSATRFCECVGFTMAVVEQLRGPNEPWEKFLTRLQARPSQQG